MTAKETIELARDTKELMDTDLFKRVIIEAYMRDMAQSIALSFDGGEEDIDTLKAISHLNTWLTNTVDNGIILQQTK